MTHKEELQRKITLYEQARFLTKDTIEKVILRIKIQDLQWSLDNAK